VQKGFNPESGWIKLPHMVSSGVQVGKAESGDQSHHHPSSNFKPEERSWTNAKA
jgi:hypothetical protein